MQDQPQQEIDVVEPSAEQSSAATGSGANPPSGGIETWDWQNGNKLLANPEQLRTDFSIVCEPTVSADGERIAIPVSEGEVARVWVNDALWEDEFEKAWHLKFGPDGRLVALVRIDDAWTVAVDGERWKSEWEFAWETRFSRDGAAIAVQVKDDMKYGVAVNDVAWDKLFPSCRGYALSADGAHVAAAVQTDSIDEADIFAFQAGIWTIAVDGVPWERKYINTFAPTFDATGKKVAAEVRVDMYEYTVAEDNKPWDSKFSCVWEPGFRRDGRVMVPVRIGGQWTLAENGKVSWKSRFVQLWHQKASPDDKRIAAVVAPSFGRWTIAIDDVAWKTTVSDAVLAPIFSADGSRVAAVARDQGKWSYLVDDQLWSESFDMAWNPVFSPDGKLVVAKVEQGGKYGLVANGKIAKHRFDGLWDPTFSPDGSKLLLRTLEDGKYHRRVIPVGEIIT